MTARATPGLVAPSEHPVVALIGERAAARSLPGRRSDEYRLGLAIEGGSMRGAVSAGMTSALEQLGLLDVFDAVYGSSAGAINGAYFLAGRAALCATSYYEEMTTRGFLDWRRALSGRPVLSLDFVLDEVAEEEKPLDWQAVLDSPIEFHPIASSVRDLRSIDLAGARTKQELKDAIRASSQVWVLAGPPLALGDRLFLDAGLLVGNPFRRAFEDGCTHVLALRTRPAGALRTGPSLYERLVIARKLRAISPAVEREFLKRTERYREEVDELERRTSDWSAPPHLYAIAPRGEPMRSNERRPARVREGVRAGILAVYAALEGETPQVTATLRAYPRP